MIEESVVKADITKDKFHSEGGEETSFAGLRSMKFAGTRNNKRYRICREVSHMANVGALQILELLEGWKLWRWEILEVS